MAQNQHIQTVTSAIDFIEANLKEPITVQDVCHLSPLSSWQFQRVFRAIIGDSIGNYLRGRRLAKAAQQLQKSSSSLRILDLAIEFQFNSQEAFTRAFKSSFGMTPTMLRGNLDIRIPTAKPKLDLSKINQLKEGIKKEPTFTKFGSKDFIGLSTQISSPLGIDTEFDGKAPLHWKNFDQRRKEIPSRTPGYSYGFALSLNQNMDEDTLTYMAAVEVPEIPSIIPSDMQTLHLPSQEYAAFEVTGYLESCHVTTDYIYGIWLPQSQFLRGQGPDFELFNHSLYRRGDPNSISFYYLPINPK